MALMRSLFAAGAALLLTTGALASDNPPFPRLAGVNNGNPHNYEDPAYQAKLAKLHLAMINIWDGWENNRGTTMDQVVRNIKKINPGTKIFLYENSMEVAEGNVAKEAVYNKVDQMNWWLYASGASGERRLSPFGARNDKPNYSINVTLHTPRDSNGYQHWEWHARWVVDKFYKPNPSIDGFFEDNVFWRPRVDADWNRDGAMDSQKDPKVGKWLREAYRERFALMRKLMPGKYIIGNVADWGRKEAVLDEYQGMLNGGIMEGLVGASYAVESWAGWHEMMRWYRKTKAALAAPKLLVFHHFGSPTDYQGMRYGLASCLLDDGYFAFTDPAKGYTGLVWFDEFDVKLGKAISPPPTTAWQKGVYRRDYEYGIALANPKGNGAQEVVLEEEFRRIAGKQAPTVNNGQAARRIQLKDRDGIILLRGKAKALPTAPKLVAVQ